jgi:hypothetical protein
VANPLVLPLQVHQHTLTYLQVSMCLVAEVVHIGRAAAVRGRS